MKNKFIIAAVAVVILASVAYALFTQTLNITGTSTATGQWNVKITNITRLAGAVGVTDPVSTPSFADTSATFTPQLEYPGGYGYL